MKAPQALLFDWDNTLVDSWGTIHEALVLTFTGMGHEPWTLEETKAKVSRSLREAFPPLFGDRWEEAKKLYMDSFMAIHLERLTVLADAAELIQGLAGKGHYLGVVSNKTGPVLRREADHLGWTPHFGKIVGATDAPMDKPHPAPVLMALEDSGFEPGDSVWFVGDTALDMECAVRSGCVPVLVGPVDPASPEFAKHPPRLHFDGCGALFRHIQGL